VTSDYDSISIISISFPKKQNKDIVHSINKNPWFKWRECINKKKSITSKHLHSTRHRDITKGFCAPNIINQSNMNLDRREEALLKLGPKYVPNNPHLAHIRMKEEIELVVKKTNKIFIEHGWVLPKQRIQIFTDSLERS